MTKQIKLLSFLFILIINSVFASEIYYPGRGTDWEHRKPEEAGFDAAALKSAVEFAIANETKATRDLALEHYQTSERQEPLGEPIGPFIERGPQTGIILRYGYIVAEWGEPDRVDMTFSATKSFVSTTVGLAYDRGLIPDLNQPVYKLMAPVYPLLSNNVLPGERIGKSEFINLFDTDHNRTITWDHLLRQTSDWEGTLWGKPDWADRPSDKPEEWLTRKRNAPGTTYEYNDVRVNVLALAALNVWQRPLPEVLKEYIMDPIGASSTWQWHGYENSWVLINGKAVQSVSGGGHWGGGMFINARDMARFGYLTLRRGKWGKQQLLSEAWVKLALTPTKPEPTYGFMNWFLNTDKKYLPSAPLSAFAHEGHGTNMIYVDPENDLVIIMRWIENDKVDPFVQKVLSSIRK
ncbi:MAG TPA: serine hydrolase [Acidobacteriota bacterium]|nr:serine hydrolase [Acidobacteriota bacterium]